MYWYWDYPNKNVAFLYDKSFVSAAKTPLEVSFDSLEQPKELTASRRYAPVIKSRKAIAKIHI